MFTTQGWGVENDAYEQFGFTRHNGLDICTLETPSYGLKPPIYAPTAGLKVIRVQYKPKGGGQELWMITKEPQWVQGALVYVLHVFFHNDKVLVPVGYEPALGELVCVGDNTGFSTGPHLHWGTYRTDSLGTKIDVNEANGSFDPRPFLSEKHAIDQATLPTLIRSNLRYYKYKVGL